MTYAGATFAGVLIGVQMAVGAAAATLVGPLPYRSAADSPFNGPFDWFRLETFESGSASIPGVAISSGVVVLPPGPLTDSVDGDDGALDGSGRGGHSLYSNGFNGIVVTFDAAVLGSLPTHVGVVFTDVGISSAALGVGRVGIAIAPLANSIPSLIGSGQLGSSQASGAPDVSVIGRDASGALIDTRSGLPFPDPSVGVLFGDGAADGATAEDRFFGVIDPRGIFSLVITSFDSTDWEFDHLQFGFSAAVAAAVPAPASVLLLTAGALGLAGVRLARRD